MSPQIKPMAPSGSVATGPAFATRHRDPFGTSEFLLGRPGLVLKVAGVPPEAPAPIVVTESIPSALALASALRPGQAHVWATLSPDGTARLDLPEGVYADRHGGGIYLPDPNLIVFASDGEQVSRDIAQHRARQAREMTWNVRVVETPEGQTWTEALANREALPWKQLQRALKVEEQKLRLVQKPDPGPGLPDDTEGDDIRR